jgi:hypothetical protein
VGGVAACVAPRSKSAVAAAPTPVARPSAMELRAKADEAYKQKSYLECARLLEEAEALDSSDNGLASLNAACCFALGKDVEHAFLALDHALAHGFRDVSGIKVDGDLASLHPDPRWPAAIQRAQANLDASLKGSNPVLTHLFEEDQADRKGDPAKINWKVVTPRDAERRGRVQEILDRGEAKVSVDFYHAAMVFQHGHVVADFATAYRLALRAVELDEHNSSAKWLAAAAKDRELMNSGKPQLYGTQFVLENGRWKLYEVDPSISDAERAKWHVPTLAEAKNRADQMNR